MKTFNDHLPNLCLEKGHETFESLCMEFTWEKRDLIIEEAAKRYAKSCAQDALNRAAENAEARLEPEGMRLNAVVDKESIIETEIILP